MVQVKPTAVVLHVNITIGVWQLCPTWRLRRLFFVLKTSLFRSASADVRNFWPLSAPVVRTLVTGPATIFLGPVAPSSSALAANCFRIQHLNGLRALGSVWPAAGVQR